MARLINRNTVELKGKEAKRVLKQIMRPNQSVEYRKKMDECVAFYREIESKSDSYPSHNNP